MGEKMNKWARAIANRIADEWDGKQDFPNDAKLLEDILSKLFMAHPEECYKLIGTGIIEEDFFDNLN